MARKTKEDAELTRQRIITAAREVFVARGVSRTTIEHIASHAEVTRGAVYWHFQNKMEIFHALRDQAFLPFIDQLDAAMLDETTEDPLGTIESFFCDIIRMLSEDLATQQTYEIIMSKCEYVDEFASVLQKILNNCQYFVDKFQLIYERAQLKNQLHPNHNPAALAMDSHLFFSGLLHMWVKDTTSTIFRNNAIQLIKNHMQLRRVS
ncbi:TetR family transcriptional regulator [Methylobacillus gramineus]|uniref:TetR family transcriptional regulator n=1 Tax=Methylobacillus gramineus TaxID=755169 RepID=UPI001D00127E|nr:TetR family transcriptional regulator [Methylobacillus gramineus]MCB5184173.1 TetR family transcriptional regulator [Methylobacillus gramineus]